jgi:hypothetical protein
MVPIHDADAGRIGRGIVQLSAAGSRSRAARSAVCLGRWPRSRT